MCSFCFFIVLHSLSFCVSPSTVLIVFLIKQFTVGHHTQILLATFFFSQYFSYFIHRIESYFRLDWYRFYCCYLRLCQFFFSINDFIQTQFFILLLMLSRCVLSAYRRFFRDLKLKKKTFSYLVMVFRLVYFFWT